MATHLKHGRIKLLFAIAMIVAVVVLGLFWQRTQDFADRPLVLDQKERVLLIESGDGFNAVLGKLRGLGVDQGT